MPDPIDTTKIPDMVKRVADALHIAYAPGLLTISEGENLARAALDAIREATPEMIAAGISAANDPWLTFTDRYNRCDETWRAMINAALGR